MKNIVILIVLSLFIRSGYSQDLSNRLCGSIPSGYSVSDTIPKVIYSLEETNKKPLVVLNGKYMSSESLSTLDPDLIDSISVDKQTTQIGNNEYYGKIYVKLKPECKLKLISVNDFMAKYTRLKPEECILSLDEHITLADRELVFVDESKIMQILVTKLSGLALPQDLYFVKLVIRAPEKVKNANVIMIR